MGRHVEVRAVAASTKGSKLRRQPGPAFFQLVSLPIFLEALFSNHRFLAAAKRKPLISAESRAIISKPAWTTLTLRGGV